jgi:hypothetical protein
MFSNLFAQLNPFELELKTTIKTYIVANKIFANKILKKKLNCCVPHIFSYLTGIDDHDGNVLEQIKKFNKISFIDEKIKKLKIKTIKEINNIVICLIGISISTSVLAAGISFMFVKTSPIASICSGISLISSGISLIGVGILHQL